MSSIKRKAEDTNIEHFQKEEQQDKENARRMAETLTNQELLDILQNAVTKHPDVREKVLGIAEKDPSHRKLFIRNLGANTTNDTLQAVFSEFGELENVAIIKNKWTNVNKGYAFVHFKKLDSALRALKEPSKRIDGRITVSQWASTGGHERPESAPDVEARKIFVGNVPRNMDSGRLLDLFSEYGEIEEGPLGFDQQSGKSKNFALFIYKTVDGAVKCLEEPVKIVNGQKLFCKLAAEGHKKHSSAPSHPSVGYPPQQGSSRVFGYGGGFLQSSDCFLAPPDYVFQGGNQNVGGGALNFYGFYGTGSASNPSAINPHHQQGAQYPPGHQFQHPPR